MKRLLIYTMIALLPTALQAQNSSARKLLRDGNKQFKKEKFDEAETSYRKALSHDTTSSTARYNLGNTLYRKSQKNHGNADYDNAVRQYTAAIEDPKISDKNKSHAYHNRGNSHMQKGLANQEQAQQEFQQAIADYQEALKIDPKNQDTKYNLSLAKKLLVKQQQQGGGGSDQNKDQKDQKDQNQQQQQDQQQQNQQQNEQKQDKQEQQKQQPQQSEQQKKDAERLLKAMENNEKKTMKEQQAKAVQAKSARIEKDW